MKNRNDVVSHEGIVQAIEGEKVIVKMTVSSACASCHAKHLCSSLDNQDKTVTAENPHQYPLEIGDAVTVVLQEKLALKAVVICFLIPFVLLFGTVVALSALSVSDLLTGLVALAVTAVYYLIIWLFRNKIGRDYTFVIHKE